MTEVLMELRCVSKHFQRGLELIRAVDQVTMQIHRGEFVTIQGTSGSGKSTLLHLLGALDWPTSGQVLFAGQDFSKLGDRALSALRHSHLGFVFQSFNLIEDLDVLHNVELPLKYANVNKQDRSTRARAALEAVHMAQRLDHRPCELSKGEEQRVAIARAIVNQPDLILADEPTGNLDPGHRDTVLQLLCSLNAQGQTIVMVTHDPIAAAVAQRKLRMQAGRIETFGSEISH
jgi:putative ABC transport system ATP-binding protein